MIWTILLVIVLSLIGKILTGVIGGRIYGLGRFKALISGLSIVNRGEFSIAISQYISIALSPIASIYILIMAILGIISSVYSKRIAKFIYPKKPVKK
jgi:CPA2 family monovalent cation:H+ antiporter-2